MVEECEDLFSIQMASLPRVSVSIVRLEEDSLSWARRSSSSQNRHLEDLEKCSRKGSVVEKKAFFETHFEKIGAECRNNYGETVSPMTYNGFLVSEITHNEECFEESSDEMDEKDYLVMEFGKPNGTSFYEHQTHSDVGINLQSEFDASCEHKDEEKICQQDGFGNQRPACDEKDIKMDDNLPVNEKKLEPVENASNETAVDLSFGKKEILLQNDVKNEDELNLVDKLHLESANLQSDDLAKPTRSQSASSKATSSYKQNAAKSKIRPDALVSQIGKRAKKEKNNPGVLKTASRKTVQINYYNASKAKPEVTTTMSATRIVKPEGSTNANPKVNQGIRGISRSKPEQTKHSGTTVNSRNDQRPKLLNSKVEEKMHAKEKNKSHPQATIQEVKEVEMNKLKNSLSFKAKPLPSFYTAAPQQANAKKQTGETPPNVKPAKQINSTSQKLSSSSKLRSDRVESAPSNQSYKSAGRRRSFELAKKKETDKINDKASILPYQQEQPHNKNKVVAGQGKKTGMVGRGSAMSGSLVADVGLVAGVA